VVALKVEAVTVPVTLREFSVPTLVMLF